MCGICGKVVLDELRQDDLSILHRMMSVMQYRGPDDEGTYTSQKVLLGHRRLSIIDLNTGKQPISNEDKSIWVVFNGEIFNYKELKKYINKFIRILRYLIYIFFLNRLL